MDARPAPSGAFRWRRAVAPGVVLLGAALRFPWLGRTFPLNDDYSQIYEALHSGGLAEFLRMLRLNPLHAMLDGLTTFVFARFGSSLAWLSLPSALAGIAAIALSWRFAARTGRRRAGLASLLLALSVMHSQWSRGIDFYALLTLMSLVQSILFFLVLNEPKRWPWYALGAAVFLHAHPYAVLFLPLHLFCAAWLGKARAKECIRSLTRAWLAAGAAFVPWFLWSGSALLRASAVPHPQSSPLFGFLARIPLFLAFAPEVGPHRWWKPEPAALLAMIVAAAYLLSLYRTARGCPRPTPPTLRYAHLTVVYGIVAVVLLDRLYDYFYAYRQLIWILPFYLLGAADGLCFVAERFPRPNRRIAIIAGAIIAAVLPLHADALEFQIDMMRRQHEIVDQLRRRLRPGDILVFQRSDTLRDILYFLDRPAFARTDEVPGADGGMNLGFAKAVEISISGGRALARVGGSMVRGQSDSAWNFYGEIYDLTVSPPVR